MTTEISMWSPLVGPSLVIFAFLVGGYEYVLWSDIGTTTAGRVILAAWPFLIVFILWWAISAWLRLYKRNLERIFGVPGR